MMEKNNWYKVIVRDELRGAFFEPDIIDYQGFDRYELYKGKRVTNWPMNVSFKGSEFTVGERVDDALGTVDATPVFSQRLQNAIVNAGITEFQFLPCQVINGEGREIFGYSVANCTKHIDALSVEHSKINVIDPKSVPLNTFMNVRSIPKPALKHEKVANSNAFRLSEDPLVLFVSEKFVEAFRKINATGIGFRKVMVV